jgi:hypothetical protein
MTIAKYTKSWIEVRGRLVQAQDARLYRQDRGYGQSLLLAAREGGRLAALKPFQAHLLQHAFYAPDHLLALDLEVLRPEGDLEGDVGREELGLEVLEDEPHLFSELADLPLAGRASFDAHLPLHPSPEEVGDQTVQRGTEGALPRPGVSHDDHELPLGHLQVDLFQGRLFLPPVRVGEIPDADRRLHYSLHLLTLRRIF